MAQHINIQSFKEERFRKIEDIIYKEFKKSNGHMHTSMKYVYIGNEKENEVFSTFRRIPKGIIWGTDKGYFEVHYNPENQEIIKIYLVA